MTPEQECAMQAIPMPYVLAGGLRLWAPHRRPNAIGVDGGRRRADADAQFIDKAAVVHYGKMGVGGRLCRQVVMVLPGTTGRGDQRKTGVFAFTSRSTAHCFYTPCSKPSSLTHLPSPSHKHHTMLSLTNSRYSTVTSSSTSPARRSTSRPRSALRKIMKHSGFSSSFSSLNDSDDSLPAYVYAENLDDENSAWGKPRNSRRL
ncbi:hypothetical protein SISNIDRAFT_487149 [Sistotremastrum niveocremeum HHB9708]|uniref:Uncharacterized protein n=1 Tax=Sistotremastrum niveocremeum HHB9708 TaxID=1314777 RepID=A0A164SV19_9AGAM|nr:hypothetical protein SISNIDRAFT_487149 [Sistotremastrum niveocremeum HHB9708]